jgi:hypothetical protein
MFLNYALTTLSVIFLIFCVLSVMSENSPSEKASSRNFFRRIRITLREINFPVFLIISAIVIMTALKTDRLDMPYAVISVILFTIGYCVLNSFRLLCGRKPARRKKVIPFLYWNRDTKECSELKNAALTKEAPELSIHNS